MLADKARMQQERLEAQIRKARAVCWCLIGRSGLGRVMKRRGLVLEQERLLRDNEKADACSGLLQARPMRLLHPSAPFWSAGAGAPAARQGEGGCPGGQGAGKGAGPAGGGAAQTL